MASSTIAALRAKSASSFSKLLETVEKIDAPKSETKNYTDERLWKLTQDAAGNGSALIRFLPALEDEKENFVTIFKHAFSYKDGVIQPQGSKGGKWYIENSLSTFDKEFDYVGEQNRALWQTGGKKEKDIATARKRTTNFYSNILVIKDPEHPENNGKVFLFKYGVAIMKIIASAMNPPVLDELSEDEEVEQAAPFNPFDIDTGAALALRISRDKNWPTYVNSSFKKQSPLCGGDEDAMEEVLEKRYSLEELLDRKHFKSYDELKKRFLEVTSSVSVGTAESADVVKFTEELESEDDVPVFTAPPPKAPKAPKAKVAAPIVIDDDDSDLSFFEKLAAGE